MKSIWGGFEPEMQAFGRNGVSSLRNPASALRGYLAAFHSTPVLLSKWRSKWKHQDEEECQKPSKTYARYVVRQKRADTKKALKDFLLYGKPSKSFEDEDLTQGRNYKAKSSLHDCDNHPRPKSTARAKPPGSSDAGNEKRSKRKRWHHNWSYDDEDYGYNEATFQAEIGRLRSFTWSFPSWGNYGFANSTAEFEWREESKWDKYREKFLNESDMEEEEEDESSDVGCHSDRVALGLPASGPLKLTDVKTAFRRSALKWHPDKHQGLSSQAVAGEKFKLCVDAYNSLCNVLMKK